MSVLTKKMVEAAQAVAFANAAERFEENPTGDNWRSLEIEMWAWQKLKKHIDEQELLNLLRPIGIGDWSKALHKAATTPGAK